MRWCRELIVLSLVCATTHSKALTSNDNLRKSRQLDFGECCPCPKPRGDLSQELSYPVEPIVDDCPCRNRAADSDGASSILSPALQALRPFTRSEDPKTEPEPLLKPEVGLASSVLKTLQEVTNEEYEDALARDATRSIVKAIETDLPLLQSENTPGSIINIILNPKETGNDLEVVPEASHLQETRCIHPLGSTHNYYDRNNLKSSIFGEPNKNLVSRGRKSNIRSNDYDMDNQASEIHGSLQEPFNSYVIKKIDDPKEITNSQETTSHKLFKGLGTIGTPNGFAKIPDLKLSTIVDNIKKSIQSNTILNKLTNKEMDKAASEYGTDIPMTTVTEEKPRKLAGTLKNFQNVINNVEKPTTLKNLLKLKDVELIPKQKLVNTQKSVHSDDGINASISDDDKIGEQQDNSQIEILDTLPSSSNRIESESTNKVIAEPQKKESNACNDMSETKQQVVNNINKYEQHEMLEDSNNPTTVINLLQNESDEQLIESAIHPEITEQNSEISSKNDQSTSKEEPTFKGNQSVEKKQDKNILPLIRADIIKSFKNFKKVNDDMQEKLRQNLQDVLQVVETDESKIIEHENSKPIENINNSKNITEDDLQRMSDSILNESRNKPSFKQSNAQNKIDNCVPTGDDDQNIPQENAFIIRSSDKSVAKSSVNHLNNPPSKLHTDSEDIMNKSENSKLEQNDRYAISKTPDITSNIDVTDKRSDKNSETNFSDSSLETPKTVIGPQSTDIDDMISLHNSAAQELENGKDSNADISEINDESNNLSTNGPNESKSIDERKCLQSNSNDMNVQASEPIGNHVNFDKTDFNYLKSDRPLASTFSSGSGLKPYFSRLSSPHTLSRDTIHPKLPSQMNTLQGVYKNNDLKNVFKNLENGVFPTSRNNKGNDISISKPLHEFNPTSSLKSRTDESLKNLNNIFGRPLEIKSNHVYKNILKNADDISHSLSIAHSDLNNKLQQLHSDWSDRIHDIGQRADASVLPINNVANARKNVFNTPKKIPLLSLETPRSESNMRGKPKTLLNDDKFKLPQFLPKSLNKAPPLSERKALILSTTTRPLPMFTTKKLPRKEVSLKIAPKPTLSQTLKDAIESAKSDKFHNKMRDMKTLSSNIKPLRVQNKEHNVRKFKQETHESMENQGNIQPYIIASDNSRGGDSSRYSGLPFQLKAEELSVLKKLLDGIRSSQLESDMFRSNDEYDVYQNENLQAPSQNVERFKMPENTLKENVSYKCKMVCTKDDK